MLCSPIKYLVWHTVGFALIVLIIFFHSEIDQSLLRYEFRILRMTLLIIILSGRLRYCWTQMLARQEFSSKLVIAFFL